MEYLPLTEIFRPNMVQMPTDIVKELIIVRTAVNPKPNFDFTCLIFAEIKHKIKGSSYNRNKNYKRTGICMTTSNTRYHAWEILEWEKICLAIRLQIFYLRLVQIAL